MSTNNKIVLSILLTGLAVVAAVYWFGVNLTKTFNGLFSPVTSGSQAIQTQIAQVLHPTPTVIADPVTIIYEVQSLARLETIQYSLEKIITAEVGQNVFKKLFGDRLLFVAHGKVIAGIDLRKITEADLWVANGTLHAKLPPAEVFVYTLHNDKSYVYDRDTGLFTKGDASLESTARKAAEEEILKSALDDGILKQADMNAKSFMTQFFAKLGYTQVIFED